MESPPFFTIDGPLFVPPPYGSIRGEHFFRGFRQLVSDLGGDCRRVLEQHDVDPVAVDDPEYPLSCTTAASILQYCSSRFNDLLFGVHLAGYQDADVYGCINTLARSAPNLRIALESMAEYLPVLHSPGADIEAVTAGQTAEFRWRPYANVGMDEQSIAHGLLLSVQFIETLGGRDFRPSYVNAVSNISKENLAFMEERFRCRVYPRAATNAIGFQSGYLDRPLRTSNRILFGLIKSYLAQVKSATTPTLTERVEAYISNALSSGNCSLERCAARLATTARTLHRHLHQRGLTFSDVVEQQRKKLAERALLETDHTLDEIASTLGYAEQSSFGRAFKRWTNMTPQAFRERNTHQGGGRQRRF